jgi:hypothetical protein
MNRKLFKIIVIIIFLVPVCYVLGSICLERIIISVTRREVVGTSCTASENGNCYCWDYDWSYPVTETTDECKKEGEKCSSWYTREVNGREECVAWAHCRCYSGPELNASCIVRAPCIKRQKIDKKEIKCTSQW